MQKRSIFILSCVGILGFLAAARAEGPAVPHPASVPAAAAPAAPAAGGAAPEARPEAPGATVHWDKMSFAERKKHMKTVVLPEMKKVFKAFDGKKYGSMDCQTCHGEKAVERKFKMPSPDLPKLPPPTDRAGFMALQEKKPEVTKFMGTQVKPTVAKLIGLAEFNMTTKTGFGCYACHMKAAGPMEGAPGAGKEGAAAAPAGATPAAKEGAAKPGGW